jgi:hypothetical protein
MTVESSGSSARVRLRPVSIDDAEGITLLFERHGWPLRSRKGLAWALFENPARRAIQADAGWVLESAGQVVGFLGNVPGAFAAQGQLVWGATCTSLLVDEAHRSSSTSLIRAFAAQPAVSFVYSATANAHSAPLYKAFKFGPCPDLGANHRLRWVTSRWALAKALLERVRLGWLLPRSAIAGASQWARRLGAADHRPRGPAGLHVDPVGLAELTDGRRGTCREAWNRWSAQMAAAPGLQADRSAQAMAWRMSDPDWPADAQAVWALRDSDGNMLGVCMVRRLPHRRGQPCKAELMDLALLPGSPVAAAALLLRAARHWAASQGAAVLDAKRWTGLMASQLSGLGARCQALPSDALWLRGGRCAGESAPLDWASWSLTGWDSDDWFNTLRTSRPSLSAVDGRGSAQSVKALLSAETSSSSVSTSVGSNRSMSSV